MLKRAAHKPENIFKKTWDVHVPWFPEEPYTNPLGTGHVPKMSEVVVKIMSEMLKAKMT